VVLETLTQEASRNNVAERLDLDVALVHDWLTVPGGSEDVFKEMCGLFPGDIFTSQWDRSRIGFCEGMPVHTSWVQKMPFALSKHYLYAPFLPGVYASMPTDEFDVILSDSHSFAHHVPKRAGALHINYYHTPARSLWTPEIDPRASNGILAPVKKALARQLRKMDLEASKNPDVILANSFTTAHRIERFYGRHVDQVIYPPVDTEKWSDVQRKGEGLGFLVFGRLIGYKRVDLAIQAAKRLNVPLQIVGSGPMENSLKDLAGGHRKITFHGRLPDAELKEVMSRCEALLFPGYEDFGIVPVEAMAAGLPVVAYGQGGASETVTNKCGVQFDDQTVDSLVEAMRQVRHREFDAQHMKDHARQFDRSVFRQKYQDAVTNAIVDHFEGAKAQLRAYAA
jgi:glycosyltransferase involved in cell wall biosynthesis